jgi:hypothetical protein
VGWAALGPSVTFSATAGLAGQGSLEATVQAWSFVPEQRLLDPRLELVVEHEPHNVTLLGVTRTIPGIVVEHQHVFDRGLDVARVQTRVGHPIARVRIAPTAAAPHAIRLNTDRVDIYRPSMSPWPARPARQPLGPALGARPAPIREEQQQRDRAAVDAYAERERQALAERHAAEEARAGTEAERSALEAQHERERAEQSAEVERQRRATEGFYTRQHQAQTDERMRITPERREQHSNPNARR